MAISEEECVAMGGHCWETPIVKVCLHCGKEDWSKTGRKPLRPGPDRRVAFTEPIGDECQFCRSHYSVAFWHRLTRGHWPNPKRETIGGCSGEIGHGTTSGGGRRGCPAPQTWATKRLQTDDRTRRQAIPLWPSASLLEGGCCK